MLLLLTSFLPLSAQETVNVAFTASTESGLYCPFTSVNVTNVTRGWTENLVYPDTVLVLTNTVNVAEHIGRAFCLGDAYPNPFTGETQALLELPEKCDVLLQVVRLDGSEVTSQTHCLDAGTYRLRVSLSVPQLAFLSVTTGYGRQVTKLVHAGDGAADAIKVDYVSSETKSFGNDEPARLDATGEFEPGDVMRYEAQLEDGGVTAYSIAVTQPQNGDEVITLRFALDCPTVTTSEATVITHISAICGGNVIDAGGLMVTARGVCWSTTPNPTMSDSHTTNGMGTGEFLSQLLDLSVETTYYVRAYATNLLCTSYGNEVEFTTLPIPDYNITVTAIPSNGGTVSGGGVYQEGDTCMVSANANAGFEFTCWIEKGEVVSTDANYTFTVTGNRDLEAHFSQQTYIITVYASPSSGGTVGGGGTYTYGQSCTVHANANSNYTFTNWTENGNVVSTNENYPFTVYGNRTLVAHFEEIPQIPVGAIDGLFTIDSVGNQVYFSQGNLQYNAAQGTHQCADGTTKQGTWRFAENQWDFVGTQNPYSGEPGGTVPGSDNANISQDYDGWIDLFGWGTSGWHDNSDPYNVNYQPWSTSGSTVNYEYNCWGYGPSTNMPSPNLTGSSANYDWGVYNPISNGGNQPNQWRSLTDEEWAYVFFSRTTSSGIRYAKANVNNVNGVILLPDDWSTSYYTLSNTNSTVASYSSNTITAQQWSTLEQHGAIFLPATGWRQYGTSVGLMGDHGCYWSASYSDSCTARWVYFYVSLFQVSTQDRNRGFSVRLVRVAEN